MKTIKLKPYQHILEAEAIIPLQIGNLYRCRTYYLKNDEYIPAVWTITNNSTYRATYQRDGRLHLVNIVTGCYLCSPIENAGSFGMWKFSEYQHTTEKLVYIIEPKDTP